MAKRGFRLRKWLSNNDKVLQEIPESERSPSAQGHILEDSTKEKLLGMLWKLKEDAFTFLVNLPEKPLTRRGILSALSSLYDPLGFVSPVILEGRLLLQALCRRKANWDEEVTPSEAQKWLEWIYRLPAIGNLFIPRCLKPTTLVHAINVEIHSFSDASSYAYGACTYMQITGVDGNRFCSFLIGKARLAPIKSVSIPRLELTAAVLAVRLNNVVKCALEAESCHSYFWTDSMAVLHSIRNKAKRFPPFVANRLAIIEQSTETAHWRYVPSDINPADIASRGVSADNTSQLQTWLEGPLFLTEKTSTHLSEESFLIKGYEPPPDFQPVRKQNVFMSKKVQHGEDAIDKLID